MSRKIKPREILEPVTRSPHRAAIQAAVKKVAARKKEGEEAKCAESHPVSELRVFLAPLKSGSRTPEEFREAVLAACSEEDEASEVDVWTE